ncbi:hAT family dimerization protein [Ceratobasidium sp. AG-Ba]|nr:hAT family dimerization protein [Ceratobasidium sp. AG-Ba]QRV91824.1 hAT family dimerization protein [Ceratobasidium sp. AG-Ba]
MPGIIEQMSSSARLKTWRSDIDSWILRVSSHPPTVLAAAIAMPADGAKNHRKSSRTTKRRRTNSDSSDIPEAARIIVTRKQTPYVEVSSRDSSPARSEEAGSTVASEPGSQASSEALQSESGSTVPSGKNRRKDVIQERRNADPKDELKAAVRRNMKSKAKDLYLLFNEPFLDDSVPPQYHVYTCKACGTEVKREIGYTTTSSFKYHLNTKCTGKPTASLEDFGINGSYKKPTAIEVRELCALWVSQCARPFLIVEDPPFLCLLDPEVRKVMPKRRTVSQDVRTIQKAAEKSIIKLLKNSPGVLHLGLDLCSLPNSIDILGIVVFRQVVSETRSLSIERFVLQCLNFDSKHTGVELAKGLYGVLRKYDIHDRVWGIVCDNASNNAAMMDQLVTYGMHRMNGPAARSFCMLHVLNLAAQAALQPFRKARKALEEDRENEEVDEESEQEDFDYEQASDDEDVDPNDDGRGASSILDIINKEDEEDSEDDDSYAEIPPLEPGTPQYTEAERAYKVVLKSAKFSKKIRYSRRAKAVFKAACVKEQVEKPHNVRRDMIIRWNSSEIMLEDADRTFPAILSTQNSLAVPYYRRLKKEDRKSIQGLVRILQPLRNVTEILSKAGVPQLCDVIVHYDALGFEYDSICTDSTLPLWLRHAAHRIHLKLNKHYGKTDDSELYRIAVYVKVLHPSLRVWYLRFAGWKTSWIETAIKIAEDVWKDYYKPKDDETTTSANSTGSQFAYSSYMNRMFGEDGDSQDAESTECPIADFVNGTPVKDKSTKPHSLVNPIAWWQGQRVLGNEFSGLTQMALDVLSAPATSVDVERAFSYVGSIVNKRRHRLAPCTLEATATLGAWSKAGLVQPGTLKRATAAAKAAKQSGASSTAPTHAGD